MRKYYRTFLYKVLVIASVLALAMCRPCFCFENNPLGLGDHDRSLLGDNTVWMSLSERERFNYTLGFVPHINTALGLPADTFSASRVHMMTLSDPNYFLAYAYTNYTTGQIYINMGRVNEKNQGGWAAVFALAHEMRHLYQDAFNTIPLNPQASVFNMAAYSTDMREADANTFANRMVTYVLNCAM